MLINLEGTPTIADAKLVEEICTDLSEGFGYGITIDLAGVPFVSTESAKIFSRLRALPYLTMRGMRQVVRQIIESTEAAQNYLQGQEGRS